MAKSNFDPFFGPAFWTRAVPYYPLGPAGNGAGFGSRPVFVLRVGSFAGSGTDPQLLGWAQPGPFAGNPDPLVTLPHGSCDRAA